MPKKEKLKGRNNQTSSGTNRLLQSKQKKKNSVENSVQNYESNINDDSNERIAPSNLTENLEADVQVGAFAVAGIEEVMNDFDEMELPDSRLSTAHTRQDASFLQITGARVVDDVIFDATPLEGISKKGLILRYSLVAIVAIVALLLLMAIIIPTIILTRQSAQVSPNDIPNVDSAKDKFLNELKPLLTTASIQELESPGFSHVSALDWLLNNSNFQQYV